MYQPPMPKAEVVQLQREAIRALHRLVKHGWTKKAIHVALKVSYQSVCRWTALPPKTLPHPALAEKILALPPTPPPKQAPQQRQSALAS